MVNKVGIVSYLQVEPEPHLVGHVCEGCEAIYLDRRSACGRCSGTSFATRDLADTGKVRTFTVIHRAGPGVATPYASLVVDLKGGVTVKANLVDRPQATKQDGVPATPVEVGSPVRLTTFVAGTDSSGTEAIGFGFQLSQEGVLDRG